jgi:hypothetical protein
VDEGAGGPFIYIGCSYGVQRLGVAVRAFFLGTQGAPASKTARGPGWLEFRFAARAHKCSPTPTGAATRRKDSIQRCVSHALKRCLHPHESFRRSSILLCA